MNYWLVLIVEGCCCESKFVVFGNFQLMSLRINLHPVLSLGNLQNAAKGIHYRIIYIDKHYINEEDLSLAYSLPVTCYLRIPPIDARSRTKPMMD